MRPVNVRGNGAPVLTLGGGDVGLMVVNNRENGAVGIGFYALSNPVAVGGSPDQSDTDAAEIGLIVEATSPEALRVVARSFEKAAAYMDQKAAMAEGEG